MGDPSKSRKKYSKPSHPWERVRIEEEGIISKDYGLKNKREIWKLKSVLRTYRIQAKRLITLNTKQAELEEQQLLKKLIGLGLLQKGAKLEDVLGVELKDLLERRLQTVVFRKNLARSANQARQFITHRHIAVGETVVNVPGYLVSKEAEGTVSFRTSSSLASQDHPERAIQGKKAEKKTVEKKPRRTDAWKSKADKPRKRAKPKEEKKEDKK